MRRHVLRGRTLLTTVCGGGEQAQSRPAGPTGKGAELVLPVRDLAELAGGRTEINVIDQAGVAVDVQERKGSDRQIVDIVVSVLENDITRGGRAARAIEQRFFLQRRGRKR